MLRGPRSSAASSSAGRWSWSSCVVGSRVCGRRGEGPEVRVEGAGAQRRDDAAGSIQGARFVHRGVAPSIGAPCDLVEIDASSVRTMGSLPEQLVLSATAADVRTVVVGGTVIAREGRLADGRDPAAMLSHALEDLA